MNEPKLSKKQLIYLCIAAVSFFLLLFFCVRLRAGGVPLLICLILHTCSLLCLYRDALIALDPTEWEEDDDWRYDPLPQEEDENENEDEHGIPFKHIYAEVKESLIEAPSLRTEAPEAETPAMAEETEPLFAAAGVAEAEAVDEAELAPLLTTFLAKPKPSVEMDLIAAARDAIESLTPFADKQNIKLHLSATCDSLIMRADPESIRILFRNIIDNSIKYMGRPGHMIITVSLLGDDIFLILKDTGNGLAEEETLHVFELNFQGSNRVSGNGLGLTQTKEIVEAFGGTIYAKSSPGNGMAIYIQLPVSGSRADE